MINKKTIALLLFDDVEVMDFAGPFEVFSVTNELNQDHLFTLRTVALTTDPIIARNGLSVNPDVQLDTIPQADIVIIPGGDGTREVLQQPAVMSWIQKISANAEHVLSVCSGALLLAGAGLLNNMPATTHHEVFDTLAELSPSTRLIRDQRFVDNGRIVTSAGISAGIDMSLYMIARLYGHDIAQQTARYMEYPYFTKTDKPQDEDRFDDNSPLAFM
ncbi:MAG: AraC family transcriptional regulator [Oceanospirillales bacterium LUC14_002_19_P2]|nr:MAG: AraC family transcriptional regulator [Oceanospirillales bacterium LUC14_002_19_P2]